MSFLHNDICYKTKDVKMLMDSSVSVSIIHNPFVRKNKFDTKKTSTNKWFTKARSFDIVQNRNEK